MNVLWGFGQVWGVHLIWEANLRSSGRHCECAGTGLWRYGSLALCCVLSALLCCAVFCVESASAFSRFSRFSMWDVVLCVCTFARLHMNGICVQHACHGFHRSFCSMYRPWLCHLKGPHGSLQEASRMVSPCVDAVITGLAWLDWCLKMFENVWRCLKSTIYKSASIFSAFHHKFASFCKSLLETKEVRLPSFASALP